MGKREARFVDAAIDLGANRRVLYVGTLVTTGERAHVRAWVQDAFSHKRRGRSMTVPARVMNPRNPHGQEDDDAPTSQTPPGVA